MRIVRLMRLPWGCALKCQIRLGHPSIGQLAVMWEQQAKRFMNTQEHSYSFHRVSVVGNGLPVAILGQGCSIVLGQSQ